MNPIYPRVCHKTVASMLTIRQSRLMGSVGNAAGSVKNGFGRKILQPL